jgi:hypothetical protein
MKDEEDETEFHDCQNYKNEVMKKKEMEKIDKKK